VWQEILATPFVAELVQSSEKRRATEFWRIQLPPRILAAPVGKPALQFDAGRKSPLRLRFLSRAFLAALAGDFHIGAGGAPFGGFIDGWHDDVAIAMVDEFLQVPFLSELIVRAAFEVAAELRGAQLAGIEGAFEL